MISLIAVLIYASIFSSVFTLIYIFVGSGIPYILKKYNKYQTKRFDKVAENLEDSFIFIEKKKYMFLSTMPIVCGLILGLLFRHPLGFLAGFVFGFAIPGILTRIIKQKRIGQFQGQIVDGLMVLASSLKAGLSLMQAIEVLCEEMPPPISQEFGLVLKENRLGINLGESLKKLRRRIPLEEVNLLVSSILVARETGGELTTVFSRLTETIRNNIKLKEKITTLTLQGKLQGIIMSALPIVFTLFIYKQNPDHFNIMIETNLGRMLLIGAVGAWILGAILIRKISQIRI